MVPRKNSLNPTPKSCLFWVGILSLGVLVACNPQSSSGSKESAAPFTPASESQPTPMAQNEAEAQPIAIGSFSTDQLFELGGGGCGMSLWRPESTSPRPEFVFFNGMDDSSMWMQINGEMVQFSRTAARGDKFYGQQSSQSFSSPNGKTTVEVNVTLGAEGEIESVAIPNGTIQVRQGGQTVTIPVVGDAGC